MHRTSNSNSNDLLQKKKKKIVNWVEYFHENIEIPKSSENITRLCMCNWLQKCSYCARRLRQELCVCVCGGQGSYGIVRWERTNS